MKVILIRRPLMVSLIILFLVGSSQSVQATTDNTPKYNHCTNCLHNATDKKDITAWGAAGWINWKNPPLNGGAWSYHRIGVLQSSPWRYVEWGWRKTSSGYEGLIGYNAGGGSETIQISGISATQHRYSMQYDPNTLQYWFFVDGVYKYNLNPNFAAGNIVMAGGETTGVEAMNTTKLWELSYLKKNPDGTFVYLLWGGHVNHVDNPPYYNVNISLNAFSDDP